MDAPPLAPHGGALHLATLGCTALLILATPATALASAVRVGTNKHTGWARVERAAFSGMGWTLWSLALVAVARGLASPHATAAASLLEALADPAREFALTGAAAAAAGGSLFTSAAAVAAATGRGRPPATTAAAPPPPRPPSGIARRPPHPRHRRLLAPGTSAALIALLGCAWATAGAAFTLAAPSLTGPAARGVCLAAAGACLLAGAGTTHGFGGRLRARALAAPAAAWRFVQPGRGGPLFIAAQAGAWGLTGCAGAGLLALARSAVAAAPGGRALAAGCAATAAALAVGQLLIGASLWVWRFDRAEAAAAGAAPTKTQAPAGGGGGGGGGGGLFWWVPLVLLYAPIHALLLLAGLSFALSPASPGATAAAWLAGTALAYALTERGDPAATGSREWPAFQAWLGGCVFRALARIGCPVSVVLDDPAASAALADNGSGGAHHPVFAAAPHGLYPISAVLASLHPSLRALTPASPRPLAVLAANAVLRAPVIRDLAAWAGVRSVSRPVAAATLAERPVLLIPGGQAELVHTWRLESRRELCLVRGRRMGFVRLAVSNGSPLVPVLVLGEATAHSELVPAPALKAATVSAWGFPFPFLPMGRWGSPFPKRGGLTLVVGRPVWPVVGVEAEGGCVVAATHALYFQTLGELVAKHAPGVTVVWEDG